MKISVSPVTEATKMAQAAVLFPVNVPVFSKAVRKDRCRYTQFLKRPVTEYEKLLARI